MVIEYVKPGKKGYKKHEDFSIHFPKAGTHHAFSNGWNPLYILQWLEPIMHSPMAGTHHAFSNGWNPSCILQVTGTCIIHSPMAGTHHAFSKWLEPIMHSSSDWNLHHTFSKWLEPSMHSPSDWTPSRILQVS